nr:ubiquitin-like domain-containing CTD phosphatase isoform X1 [Ipomoea trifida]
MHIVPTLCGRGLSTLCVHREENKFERNNVACMSSHLPEKEKLQSDDDDDEAIQRRTKKKNVPAKVRLARTG